MNNGRVITELAFANNSIAAATLGGPIFILGYNSKTYKLQVLRTIDNVPYNITGINLYKDKTLLTSSDGGLWQYSEPEALPSEIDLGSELATGVLREKHRFRRPIAKVLA